MRYVTQERSGVLRGLALSWWATRLLVDSTDSDSQPHAQPLLHLPCVYEHLLKQSGEEIRSRASSSATEQP
ncbi:unnamed protein product [Amoebophrya sp. A25]|nr:unnamed protein product [Amoebophrya sp. A25]|eukprot:GSA25T00009369001.1